MNLRAGLVLFFALVLFDGAVRKWLLPESEQLVYIAKDVLLALLLAVHLMRQGPKLSLGKPGEALMGWLGAYVAITALQVLNPSLPSLVLGLIGFKSYALYAALLLLVPAAFRDVDELARLLRYLTIPIILVLLFGVVQFYFGAEHPINRYVRGATQDVATFGLINKVRITSTFSYVSGMTTFVFFALCLGFALLAAGRWRLKNNKLAIACIVAAVVVTPMTGARWIYYMAVLGLPLFLFAMVRSDMLHTRHALRLIVLSTVAFAALSYGSIEALESFQQRRQSSGDTPGRIEGILTDPFKFGAEAGLLGYGSGATHQAATVLMRDAGYYSWLPTTDFENELGRITLELGIAGFVVAFGLRLWLCRLAWLALLNGQTREEKALAAAALVFFFAHLLSPIVFNVTAGALYWFLAGVVTTVLRDQHRRRVAVPEMPPGGRLTAPARMPP